MTEGERERERLAFDMPSGSFRLIRVDRRLFG